MMQSLTPLEGAAAQDPSGAPKPVRWIPKPEIPLGPVLSLPALFSANDRGIPSLLDIGKPLFLTAGRMAIAQALKVMALQPGDEVLLPAYHCPDMVDPLAVVGASPVFYRLRDDLSADLDDIAAKLSPRARVLVAVNYFGFPNRLTEIREFCDNHSLFFLEDCAHSLFGSHKGRPLGSFGHYAIASAPKFFPVRDGGFLASSDHQETLEGVGLKSQPARVQLRQSFDTLEEATTYGRLPLLRPPIALAKLPLRWMRGNRPAEGAGAVDPGPLHSATAGAFDAAWVDIEGTRISEFICGSVSRKRLAERRLQHFRTILAAFSGSKGFRPLFTELPEGVVPYMFPLYVDKLGSVFSQLEDRAVPMLRFGQFPWPGTPAETCPVSSNMSRCLVQFPCHQELSDTEVATIISRVLQVMEAANT